jgi:hypothetical protein
MDSRKRGKSFFELTDEEKEREVARYDREFVADEFRPLTPAERAEWQRAKRKRGRPVQGQGAQVVSVSVEKGLLAASDKLAAKKRITRAKLIARGLRAMLAAEGFAAP